jgi:hypothetical protein
MQDFSPFSSLNSVLKESGAGDQFGEFFRLMKRKDEDCPEEEDCGSVTSPCCEAKVGIVFASFPLRVKCAECSKEFLFSKIVAAL